MAMTEELLAPNVAFRSDGEIPATNGVLRRHPLDDIPAEKRKHILDGRKLDLAEAPPNDIPYNEKKPNTNGTAPEHKGSCTDRSKYSIPMDDKLAFTARKLRVITVGAGFSGLLMAHKFQHRFPEMDRTVDHTIFEKRGDYGGTWLANTYPGVQCDVPSHIYVRSFLHCKKRALLTKPCAPQAFPFDPNPNWSRFYSSGAEIQQYILNTVEKWNLDRDVQLNTEVTKAVWEATRGQWKVTVEHCGQSRDEWADVLISGQGVLE